MAARRYPQEGQMYTYLGRYTVPPIPGVPLAYQCTVFERWLRPNGDVFSVAVG